MRCSHCARPCLNAISLACRHYLGWLSALSPAIQNLALRNIARVSRVIHVILSFSAGLSRSGCRAASSAMTEFGGWITDLQEVLSKNTRSCLPCPASFLKDSNGLLTVGSNDLLTMDRAAMSRVPIVPNASLERPPLRGFPVRPRISSGGQRVSGHNLPRICSRAAADAVGSAGGPVNDPQEDVYKVFPRRKERDPYK